MTSVKTISKLYWNQPKITTNLLYKAITKVRRISNKVSSQTLLQLKKKTKTKVKRNIKKNKKKKE